MRIALIGVSHWHTPFYSEPVLEMPDATIVGVSDPDVTRAEPLATRAKCPVFADYRDMCASVRPDFAFVLGRHCAMADEARFLIANAIPFAIEKPCGLNQADVVVNRINFRAGEAENVRCRFAVNAEIKTENQRRQKSAMREFIFLHKTFATCHRSAQLARLFADEMQRDAARVVVDTVFPQINPLPRSERELSSANGN